MRPLVVMLFFCLASPTWGSAELVVSDPQQVAELVAVSKKLDAVSARVMACLERGKPHPACLCASANEILAFNASVAKLFATYPQFTSRERVRFKGPDGLWTTHNLPGLRRQASSVPECP